MPSLDWIGKKAVVNHHKQVPFHLLRQNMELSAGDPDSKNLLVQGDNLVALKALLPYYAGQVKCIYIDPPYNTGVDERDEMRVSLLLAPNLHRQILPRLCLQTQGRALSGCRVQSGDIMEQ